MHCSYGVLKFLQRFQQQRMYVLDRPLLPKYTRARLNGETLSSPSSRCSSAQQAPSTASTRVSAVSTKGRPYSTTERRESVASCGTGGRSNQGKSTAKTKAEAQIKKADSKVDEISSAGYRQSSADSGILIEEKEPGDDSNFILPPRITSYLE